MKMMPINCLKLEPVPSLGGAAFGFYFFVIIVFVISVCHPFLYGGMYAGDAIIHLVFAENASHGHFFEFNIGEKVAGETSPGYMLGLSVLFWLFPCWLVPAVVKVINVVFWYGLLCMLFLIARRIWENNFYAWCVVLLAALMPGSVYNSVVGMENGIFAFVILVWIYLAIYWKWFEMPDALPIWKEMSLGAWLGLALWLRPEGSVFFFIVLACQFFFGKMFSKSAAHNLKHGLILSAPFLIFAAGLVYFNWVHTGSLLPTSGLSRIFISARDSFWLGFFRLDPKFLMRLVYYFPLTLFWLVGNWIIFSNKKASRHSNIMVFFVLTFWIFFVLFSTVLSTAHLARYIIFISPFMIIISVVGAIWVWKNWGFIVPPKMGLYKNAAFFILIASLLLIFLLEISVRLKLDTHNSLTNMMRAPLIRKEYSDAFYVKLGKPFFSPIFIAMQEVQVRYLLDQRFVVCSLDGRVDPVLLKYVKNGNVDHLGYIKERKINFIIDIPNYNRDRTCWSLADLQFLKTGESFTKEGVSFTALPFARWWFRVIINK